MAAERESGCGDTGVLLDFSDEQVIQFPQALMMTAEMDDTFGIFHKKPTPRSNSTPACSVLHSTLKAQSSNSGLDMTSTSFIGLNQGFVCGSSSASDFSAWAGKSSEGSGNNYNGNRKSEPNLDSAESGTEIGGGHLSNDSGNARRPSEDVGNQTIDLDSNSVFISPIVNLEGSDHDKGSLNLSEISTDSDILNINDLSTFSSDSELSDYLEMRDSNFKRIDLGLELPQENGGRLSPKTPSPTSVLSRTPSVHGSNFSVRGTGLNYRDRDAADRIEDCTLTAPSVDPLPETAAAKAPTPPEPVYVPVPVTPVSSNRTYSSSTPVVKYIRGLKTPKKQSPGPALDSLLNNVDEMFSRKSPDDPVAVRQARARIYSHPSIQKQVEDMFADPKHSDGSEPESNNNGKATFLAPAEPGPLNVTQTRGQLGVRAASEPDLPTTPESSVIGTPDFTPIPGRGNQYTHRPSPAVTPLSSSTLPRRSKMVVPIPRLSFSSSSSSGPETPKKLILANQPGPKVPAKAKPFSFATRRHPSDPTIKLSTNQKEKTALKPLKATMASDFATAAAASAASESRTVCASAPVSRKFGPPIAASSPKPSKAGASGASRVPTLGTPPKTRKSLAVRSSGYGQQALNQSRAGLDTSISRLDTSVSKIPSSPRTIPAPKAMPSPIRTRIDNAQLYRPIGPALLAGMEKRRSLSQGDIVTVTKPNPNAQTQSKKAPDQTAQPGSTTNKENKPKSMLRFGFRK